MLVHDHSERITEQTDVHAPDRTLTWDEARAAAHSAGPVLSPELVCLAQSLGRVLAEPLHGLVAVPPVDCSAMDGYAVCGPSPWSVVAQVRAGDGVPEPLRPGTACEVATGAPVPPWTGGVLPYEQAWRAGELVSGRVNPGRHVRWAGEECAAGDEVLPAGVALGPAALGLAATLGHDELPVRRAPRVDALVTGNEVLEVGIPAPGQVRDAIGPMLPGLVSWAGGSFGGAIRLVDSAAQLIGALRGADAEIVLVSGSSSRGPADHLRTALVAVRAELLIDGVACRPGHPQALARLPGGQLVIGLPGNPMAAFVAYLTLALPAITGLLGRPLAELAPASPLRGSPGLTRLVPVQVMHGGEVVALPHSRSAMLRGVAAADALAVITPSGYTRLHPLPGPA